MLRNSNRLIPIPFGLGKNGETHQMKYNINCVNRLFDMGKKRKSSLLTGSQFNNFHFCFFFYRCALSISYTHGMKRERERKTLPRAGYIFHNTTLTPNPIQLDFCVNDLPCFLVSVWVRCLSSLSFKYRYTMQSNRM